MIAAPKKKKKGIVAHALSSDFLDVTNLVLWIVSQEKSTVLFCQTKPILRNSITYKTENHLIIFLNSNLFEVVHLPFGWTNVSVDVPLETSEVVNQMTSAPPCKSAVSTILFVDRYSIFILNWF